MCEPFLSTRNEQSKTSGVILPYEENHGITLRCLKEVLTPVTHILQSRALRHEEQGLLP